MDKKFDHAIGRQWHTVTTSQMADAMKAILHAQPVIEFANLTAGQTVYYKPVYGKGDEVLTVAKTLPSGKMVDVCDPLDKRVRRITAARYAGTFRLMNDELSSYLGMTHEQVVKEAIARELEIPTAVRVLHPLLFVKVPERFKPERVVSTLQPQWGRFITVDAVDKMIELRHSSIRKLEEEVPKCAVLNPDHVQDYHRYIEGYNEDLDFFRWLRPLVDIGGTFYIGPQQQEKAAA